MSKITVIKRNGFEVDFDENRIINAVKAAAKCVNKRIEYKDIRAIVNKVTSSVYENEPISVEHIQDIVLNCLKELGYTAIYTYYNAYRKEREAIRNDSDLMEKIGRIAVSTSRDNANKH